VLTFDDHGSPWHTRCVVEAADEPGLLHTLSVAFANAGVSVHAASVTTEQSEAIDTFELTDRNGAKLDAATKARLAEVVVVGVRPRRRRVTSSG
jgi:UTP:GlnB (protein PII) uridylyltransferase